MTAQADSGEQTTASTEAAKPRATTFPAAGEQVGGRVTQVYNDYQTALGQVQRDAAQRQADAAAAHAKAVTAAQTDNSKLARDAYLDYVKEYHRAQVDPEAAAGTDLYRAQSEYQEANQAAVQATQEAVDAANRAYTDEMQAIQAELCTRWESAYADYVEALHESLTAADPATFDASTLSSIAQTMMYAAASATSCATARAS